ncbi:MAG: PAS domain S-box protein [Chloroflexota bacterium]
MAKSDTKQPPTNPSELHALYQLAFNQANESIIIVNRAGQIVLANQKALDTIGRANQEIVGKTFFDLFPKHGAEEYYAIVEEVFNTRNELSLESPQNVKGEIRWFQSHFKPLQDDHGNISHVVSNVTEITEYKNLIEELNSSHSNLNNLLENSNDIILVSDKNSQIVLFNSAAAKLIKTTQNIDLRPGISLKEISKDEKENAVWRQMHQRVLQGEVFRQEISLSFPDGNTRLFETSFQPIYKEGKVIGFSEFSRDITERKFAEVALAESEMRFRQLADHIPEIFWICSPDWGEVFYISPTYEQVTGRTCESLYQNPASWLEGIVEEDHAEVQAALTKKINGDFDNPYSPEYRIIRPDGSIRWILSRAFPIHDHKGKVVRVAGISEDITTRKNIEDELRKSEARYRNLFSTMLNGFGLYDAVYDDSGIPIDFRIREVNHAFEEITGLRGEDLIGASLLEMIPGAEDYWREAFANVNTTGEPIRMEGYSQDFDKHFQLVAFQPTADSLAVLFSDISKQVIAEQELNNLNIELEKRVTERTLQLEKKNKDIESFSYSVSHDLRAPLRAISGFGQILLDEYAENWEEEPKKLLDRMIQAGKKMDSLIDGLLTLSRINQVGLNITQLNLSVLAEQAFALLSENFPGRDIRFSATKTPDIKGDPSLLEALLANLISNALKFSSKQKTTKIEFGCQTNQNEQVFYLKDNGIGFSENHAERLFAPFQRFENENEYEGTGIGLTIAKQIVERHNGSVWAESQPGEGATFYFKI